MKSNNRSVEGIFKYSDDLTFEANDFVIQDGGLYVCLQESVGNKPSTSPEYFKPYLSDKCVSVQEYLDEIESPDEGEDKYVSAVTLSGILNYYMTGFSKKGLITNTIDILDSGDYTLMGDVVLDKSLKTRDEVFDYLLNLETLNNGVFTIEPGVFDDSDDSYSRILRQYSYIRGTNRYRVQELIDLNTGEVRYRVGSSDGTISEWKSISDNIELNTDINSLRNYYESEINKVENELAELKNSFRWKKVTPSSGDQTSVSVPIGNIYTTVISWVEDNKKRSESVTTTEISESSANSEQIYIAPSISVSIYRSPLLDNSCTISVNSSDQNISPKIECVYYSEYYK